MKELKDYSGEFSPGLKLEDFSKDALLRLFHTTAKLYLGMDGVWHSLIREKFGEQVARDLDVEVWSRATPIEISRTMAAMNIQGDDVATLFKVFQCDPGTAGVGDVECELKDKNHGIYTVKRCSSLEHFERHGDIEGIKWACEVIDTAMWTATTIPVNPKIKVTPLKRPPRKSKDEIACQWEFRLEG